VDSKNPKIQDAERTQENVKSNIKKSSEEDPKNQQVI
jgi:hypothetical protein